MRASVIFKAFLAGRFFFLRSGGALRARVRVRLAGVGLGVEPRLGEELLELVQVEWLLVLVFSLVLFGSGVHARCRSGHVDGDFEFIGFRIFRIFILFLLLLLF